MPCVSYYMEPDSRERESRLVLSLLREIGLDPGKFNNYYGRPVTLDQDTRALCEWCKTHKDEIKNYSLEFQMWWRDHQRTDAAREERERIARLEKEIQEKALKKLSTDEKKALGL